LLLQVRNRPPSPNRRGGIAPDMSRVVARRRRKRYFFLPRRPIGPKCRDTTFDSPNPPEREGAARIPAAGERQPPCKHIVFRTPTSRPKLIVGQASPSPMLSPRGRLGQSYREHFRELNRCGRTPTANRCWWDRTLLECSIILVTNCLLVGLSR